MLQKVIDWVTANFFGYVRVRSVERLSGHFPMVDITVEPSHEFLIQDGFSWMRTHNCVIDDPFSEQDIINGNYGVFDKVYEWYAYGARPRLMPGGRVAILHCLVGATQVTLGDGTAKSLRDIRPGDMVASYDNGIIRPAKVLAWANQGSDRIFTIALKSGNRIRGNERHPFLVHKDGVESWVKVKDLKPGMLLVATKDAYGRPITKQDAVS